MMSLSLDEVVRRIRRQARGRLDDMEVARESTMTDLGLSSLQVTDMVFGIEDDFDIEFDESRVAELATLGDLLDLANEAARM